MIVSELKQVKASAGSGKTYQLTRRFLSLLFSSDEADRPFTCQAKTPAGHAWPEILAVTFTNKAATEMKERVVGSLKKIAFGDAAEIRGVPEATPARAASALNAILRRYHRLNIRTIDSLLSLLLRLFALEFRIRPDFEIAFDESELFNAIFDHFAERCEADGPERDELAAALDTMIRDEGKNGFWLQDAFRTRLGTLVNYLRTAPANVETDPEVILDLLKKANAEFRDAVVVMQRHLEQRGLPATAHFKKFLVKCTDLGLFDKVPDSATIKKTTICDCLLKAGKSKADENDEQAYATMQRAWADYGRQQAELAGAHFLAPTVRIARSLLHELDELQKQRGIVLGSALAAGVADLLEDGSAIPEAYCRMGCRLHHMLVDEFQDTSREQWRASTPLAVECLAKGGSLYFVGDVKQAIYGWRGGDSALFDEVLRQPDIAPLAMHLDSENLPDNWRSHRNVVDFNNWFFQHFEATPRTEELARHVFRDAPETFLESFSDDMAEGFRACTQGVPDKHAETGGYIRLERLAGGKVEEEEQAALEALGQSMDDILARRPCGDVAVLVRTHAHAKLVCDLLVARGVPVITENSLQLDKHPIVRQLAAFLAFLDYPRDNIAFADFAGGAEVFLAEAGMAETEFFDWLSRPRKKPLGVQFREDFPDIWKRCVEPFYNRSGLMTPYDLTQEAVRAFRILERHPDAELYVRRFLEVVHLAEENGLVTLSAFLDFWEQNSGQEKVPLPENIDAVRIMTIHKSKGLEFPVVIVPFHNWKVGPDRDYELRRHNGHQLLVPMRKGLGQPYFESMGRAVREQLNLLYVAWTRAGQELHGFFTDRTGDSPAQTAINLILDLPEGQDVFEQGEIPATLTTAREAEAVPASREIAPREQAPELMEWLPRLRVYRHNLDEYFYNERMRGEVAHRAMERLVISGIPDADRDRAVFLAMQDFPAIGSLSRDERETLEADLRSMLDWALQEKQLAPLLAKGVNEPEIMDENGDFHRVDRLCQSPQGTIVIEYKTGQIRDEHQKQVNRYLSLLKAMGSPAPLSGMVVYLDLHEIHDVTGGNA